MFQKGYESVSKSNRQAQVRLPALIFKPFTFSCLESINKEDERESDKGEEGGGTNVFRNSSSCKVLL
jgi:hypothetical protein